jgi:hypothetical protein
MQLSWHKDRDKDACANVHVLRDLIIGKNVAKIYRVRRGSTQYQVHILDSIPWHRKSLKLAKSDCEHVYTYCKRK